MAESALSAQGLSLLLGKRPVVRQFSAALEHGQWIAIVGPNGAGKSSLISMLAGLRKPAQGVVLLSGVPLTAIPVNQRARQLTWLAQQGAADGEIAAIDVVRLGRLPHHGLLGSPSRDDELAVHSAMRETQCLGLAARPLNQLSGGEQQRVLLARALAAQTPLLLLDEPTTHLDVPHQRLVVRNIKARVESGAAVVAVLHDLTLALMADRVWLMDQGRLIIDAVPADPALHAALADVFEQAMTIETLERDDGHHLVVRPLI